MGFFLFPFLSVKESVINVGWYIKIMHLVVCSIIYEFLNIAYTQKLTVYSPYSDKWSQQITVGEFQHLLPKFWW